MNVALDLAGELGTAASHASTLVPVTAPRRTAAQTLDELRGQAFESAAVVAVLHEGRLVGLVTHEDLLRADPDAEVGTLMDREPPVVHPALAQEKAAWIAVQHGEATLAVVDDDGTFRGLVPATTLLRVLLEEHDEDIARLGGYLRSTQPARATTTEPVLRRLAHRLPWLLLGLAGSMVAALVVGAFEAELAGQVLIAYFVPGVVYMADAVGTQTEAVVIRGLSVGIDIRRILVREVLTGVVLGVLLGGLAYPVVALGWGDSSVALAVALALLAASSIATVVALALPWLFDRFGRDPAFGSGPLATVIQDVLTVAIYLATASAIAF